MAQICQKISLRDQPNGFKTGPFSSARYRREIYLSRYVLVADEGLWRVGLDVLVVGD